MARLLIHLEGQTEETFVNEILGTYLSAKGYYSVGARIVGNARLHDRGGIKPWPSVKRDIVGHLKEDTGCIATTMVDYYGLPQQGDRAWPGRAEAASLQSGARAGFVEDSLLKEISSAMGQHFNPARFIPFVIMHEFEGLLFSDCAAFSRAIGRPYLQSAFQVIRDEFPSPEDINDSPTTAPSKRITSLIPGYQKPLLGSLAALEIGLDSMRRECPHFNNWLERLESAANHL